MPSVRSKPLLRVPPFPNARLTAFDRGSEQRLDDAQVDQLISEMKRLRVGGEYWADQPSLPDCPYVLVATTDAARGRAIAKGIAGGLPVLCRTPESCDPWHLLSAATHVIADGDQEVALVSAIAGVPLTCVRNGPFSALENTRPDRDGAVRNLMRNALGAFSYLDPFTATPISVADAIGLCGFWRRLIDSNRGISGAVGFGFWKRETVAPLLWNGSEVDFASNAVGRATSSVAVWKSRAPAAALDQLSQDNVTLIEVEDGFIRSAGLGADCVPPLSIVVDPVGIYFNPARPSLLEQLMQSGAFTPELLQRARELRNLIVASGVSKYGAARSAELRRRTDRTHILVPGQVEDDRSVQCGGGEVKTNLELLRRVRRYAPEGHIIYKPHPDVEAGHRVGAIADDQCLALADEIVRDQSIGALIALADEVHVNTSLAGFEALLRSKPVTTHGVPFYAGWGLTRDLGAVPERRTARRSLDELVAASLLLYPRYLDPVTGLPCPPEVVVSRIAEGTGKRRGAVVQLRRLQGRWKKFAARARGAR